MKKANHTGTCTLEDSIGLLGEAVAKEKYENEMFEQFQDILNGFNTKYYRLTIGYKVAVAHDLDESSIGRDMDILVADTVKEIFAVADRIKKRGKKNKKYPIDGCGELLI